MFRKFFQDRRGNYAMMTAIAIVPLLGGLALAVDYTEMSRQRQDTLNALDAANIATARRLIAGDTESKVRQYAKDFFEANLSSVNPANTVLTVELPAQSFGGGVVTMTAALKFKPYFLSTFMELVGDGVDSESGMLDFKARSQVRLRNTVEVALVLDNSGSMDDLGKGSGLKRIDLLKNAANQLVDDMAKVAEVMQQVNKPIQFSLVPFAASVNVGPGHATDSWMDLDGVSPIHHENFDWSTMTGNKKVQLISGVYYKKGSDWGAEVNQKVTRFTLFNDLKRKEQTGTTQQCTTTNGKKTCVNVPVYGGAAMSYASWTGCVEARPSPYNVDDTLPSAGTPATLYVPMFGPDEAGDTWKPTYTDTLDNYSAENNWWNDGIEGSDAKARQRYAKKYFDVALGVPAAVSSDGPNASCTTKPITQLTDIGVAAGKTAVKTAINAMAPNGATNVPEGMAWGWRTLSSQAPFTGGRPEIERGNDKVVIVLTDGANTYYTPESLGYADSAGNKSTYSAFGYVKPNTGTGRIFQGTSVSTTDYSNTNYSKAMNDTFLKLCLNANGGENKLPSANLIVMTIALDLDSAKTADKAQLTMLEQCASRSRYRKDPNDVTKGAKLFWNATGANLSQVFKDIAAELSNLRIIS